MQSGFKTSEKETPYKIASKYNNFYEFTSVKEGVWQLIDAFKPRPWQLQVSGLVENPKTYEVDELMMLSMEDIKYVRQSILERQKNNQIIIPLFIRLAYLTLMRSLHGNKRAEL